MKKVLIIGPDFFGYNESVASAFQSMDFTTKIISYGELYTPISVKNKILYNLSINKKEFLHKNQDNLNQLIIETYNILKPELVFVIKANKLYRETLEHMDKSIKVLWMMDSIYEYPDSYANIPYFNHLFMFEKTDVIRLESEGIKSHFLPLAVDNSVYFPINNSKKDIDIVFIGNIYPKRMEMLQRVIVAFPNKTIKFYGRYIYPSQNFIKFIFRNQREYFTNKNVSPKEANSIYNKSKICINIHHDQSKHGVNQRFFEILGSKTLQIVDKNPFIEEYFTEDEIVTYSHIDDLIELVKKYLNNYPSDIVNNGYNKVCLNHTFSRRINYVMKMVSDE